MFIQRNRFCLWCLGQRLRKFILRTISKLLWCANLSFLEEQNNDPQIISWLRNEIRSGLNLHKKDLINKSVYYLPYVRHTLLCKAVESKEHPQDRKQGIQQHCKRFIPHHVHLGDKVMVRHNTTAKARAVVIKHQKLGRAESLILK